LKTTKQGFKFRERPLKKKKKRPLRKRIHVNQHILRRNKKIGMNDPALTVKTYKSNHIGNTVKILGPSKIVSQPFKPLPCGATIWVETYAKVIINHLGTVYRIE